MKDKSSVLQCITLVDETGKWACLFSHNSDFRSAAQGPFAGINHPWTPVSARGANHGNQ